MQVAAFLMWSEEGDGHFAAGADLALQSFANFSQGEVRAEMRAKFGKAEARSVKAGLAGTSVVIIVGHIFEGCGF